MLGVGGWGWVGVEFTAWPRTLLQCSTEVLRSAWRTFRDEFGERSKDSLAKCLEDSSTNVQSRVWQTFRVEFRKYSETSLANVQE